MITIWYIDIPTDRAKSVAPIILAVSNSADGVRAPRFARYVPVIATPIMPTSGGFCVRNQSIPTIKAQKITIDNPPNIDSKGNNIVPNGLDGKSQVPNCQQSNWGMYSS